MESLERCVIWGDDPETRRRLGAGAPGASGHALQGTAAEAAVPMSCAGRRAGRPRPAVLALAAALLACGAFAAGP